MHDLISNKKDYDNFESRGDLFKIQTDSNDYVEITGLAYQKKKNLVVIPVLQLIQRD